MPPLLHITHFTDPACPFAFSAEPVRRRLRWHYGDQLVWEDRMIVLSEDPSEPRKLQHGAPNLQRLYGMPIDPSPYRQPVISRPACAAVVAARLHAPDAAEAVLRALRVRAMAGGRLDDPALIDAAAGDAGIDAAQLRRWVAGDDAAAALEADIAAARAPSPAAGAQDHKLSGKPGERRYAAPSYEIVRVDGAAAASIPGFNPVETYESAFANLAPELERRPRPAEAAELVAWADGTPLATAEVALILEVEATAARTALARVARPTAAGADFYWSA
jgi:predicted DsbA family dithiol-disulfide isomerase